MRSFSPKEGEEDDDEEDEDDEYKKSVKVPKKKETLKLRVDWGKNTHT